MRKLTRPIRNTVRINSSRRERRRAYTNAITQSKDVTESRLDGVRKFIFLERALEGDLVLVDLLFKP